MLAGMSQFISICCDSFVYNRFPLGTVHEHIGMKPIGRAASDWECYLHLAPLFLFLRKINLGSAKICCRCFLCAINRTPIFPLSIISVIPA